MGDSLLLTSFYTPTLFLSLQTILSSTHKMISSVVHAQDNFSRRASAIFENYLPGTAKTESSFSHNLILMLVVAISFILVVMTSFCLVETYLYPTGFLNYWMSYGFLIHLN